MNFQEIKMIIEKEVGDKNVKINGMKLKSILKNNHPEMYEFIQEAFKKNPNYSSVGNVIWCIRNDFDIDSYKCKNCGKQLKLKDFPSNLITYCSTKCAMSDKDMIERRMTTIKNDPTYYERRQEKTRKTNLERYGVDVPAKSKAVVEKMKETYSKNPNIWNERNEKSKQTCLEHYGVENPSQSSEIKEKKKATCMKNFGVEFPSQSEEVREKYRETCLEKFGVDNTFKTKEVIDIYLNKSWSMIQTWKDYIVPMFAREEYTGYSHGQEYEWKCVKCGNVFKQRIYHTKFLKFCQFVPRCEKCFPKTFVTSAKESVLFDFVKEYFPNARKDRDLIKPLELDILIPEIKLAIEFNGCYWHNTTNKEKLYHLNKTKLCNEKGYRLIHIWEDEWTYNSEDIKNRLKDIFKGNEDLNFSDDEIILDRSWYNNIEIPGYILKEEVEPEELIRLGEECENCGYMIYEIKKARN